MALRPAIEHSAYDADARERFLDEPAKRPVVPNFREIALESFIPLPYEDLLQKPKLQFRGLVIFQELGFHIL